MKVSVVVKRHCEIFPTMTEFDFSLMTLTLMVQDVFELSPVTLHMEASEPYTFWMYDYNKL